MTISKQGNHSGTKQGEASPCPDPMAFYMSNQEAQVSRSADAHCSNLEGEAILLNLDNGMYYSMNGMGTELWDVLESPCSVKTLLSHLMSFENVLEESAQRDLGEFLWSLSTEGLIHLSNNPPGR